LVVKWNIKMNNNQSAINKRTNQQQTESSEQYQFDNAQENKVQRKCFNCGWGLSESADICENCGEWLLKGKCNFCYAEVEEGQKFCSECGNPPTGISCKSCGTLSHFDFCPQCNASLTEQASEAIELIVNSIEFQNLIKINEGEIFNINEKSKQSDIEFEKLKRYLSKFSEQNQKKKNVFSLNESPNINIDINIKAIELSKQNIKNEELTILLKHQKELEALKLLEDTRSKIFSSNQEARKYFGALKVLLPKVIQKRTPIGWRCSVGYIHRGPHECSLASSGGTWIYNETTETSFIETEI